MYFITVELRRSYAVAAITLWPVIAKKYGVVTRSYAEKNADTRIYVGEITDARSYVGNIVVTSRRFF